MAVSATGGFESSGDAFLGLTNVEICMDSGCVKYSYKSWGSSAGQSSAAKRVISKCDDVCKHVM